MRQYLLRFLYILCALALVSVHIESLSGEEGIAASDHPYLWKIPGAVDSWAFGTIHLSSPQVTTFHPLMQAALDNADVVYTEIPLDGASLAQAMIASQLPPGERLTNILPDDLRQRLDSELRRINRNLSINAIDNLQVWAATTALSTLPDQLAHPGRPSVDTLIWRSGMHKGKEARALETVDSQIRLFSDMSIDDQLDMLRETLDVLARSRDDNRDPIQELIDLYRSGRTDRFEDFFMQWSNFDDPRTQALMERLLTQRNVAMAASIADHLAAEPDRSHFFAIGAAHFADGPEGIPALLHTNHNITLTRSLPPP